MPAAAGQAGNGVAWSALAVWVATASVGLSLVTIWMGRGGPGQLRRARSRLRPALVVSHVLFAVTALGVWIAYLALNRRFLAQVSVGLLVVVAVLGSTSFTIWQRRRLGVLRATEDSWDLPPDLLASRQIPAEQHFPVAVVVLHGVLAVGTLALVALLAFGAVDRTQGGESRASAPAPARAPATTSTPPPPAAPATPAPTPNAGVDRAEAAGTRFRLAVTPRCVPRDGRVRARLRVSGGAATRRSRRARVARVAFAAGPGGARRLDRRAPYLAALRIRSPGASVTVRARVAATRGRSGARLRLPTLSRQLTACS